MVTKTELIKRLAEKEVCSPSSAKMQIENVFAVISEALENNEVVRLHGFGIFKPKEYASRSIYNPIVKKKVVVPSFKTVLFKIASDYKDKLNA